MSGRALKFLMLIYQEDACSFYRFLILPLTGLPKADPVKSE
jgi:hypothetical protein